MKIIFNIKPYLREVESRDDIFRVLNIKYYNYQQYKGSFFITNNDNKVVMFNITKYNKKTKQLKYKNGEKKGRTKKSIIIREKHYEVRYYVFSLDVFKFIIDSGYNYVQDNNHFKLKKN